MELKENMEFEITNKFIPNFYQAKQLKILTVHEKSVRIEIGNARARGVFPIDQFYSLIRNGALLQRKEDTA
jgi:hypothetical protein